MTKSQKSDLHKIILTSALFVLSFALISAFDLPEFIYLLPYAIISFEVLSRAVRNIIHGQIFDENFLMAVASLGAIGIGNYPEAVAVVLFYEIGELFEDLAVGKSRNSIAGLMELRPDVATVEIDGELVEVDPYEVSVGDIIVVKPGDRVPIDGTVVSGGTSLDTMALTGESVPRYASEGDSVISGSVAIDGLIKIRADKEFDDSTVSKILDLVDNSSLNKARSEDFITRFAKWYTPAVVFSAVAVALVPLFVKSQSFSDWINRALIFLVVSCPCALVVSVPLTYFSGIGAASKKGVLIKGSNHLEDLSQVKTAVFDKTGTLTKGQFEIEKTEPNGCSEEELLRYAAICEHYSNHPIALAIKKGAPQVSENDITDYKEIPGSGITAQTKYGTVCAGNVGLMAQQGIEVTRTDRAATAVYVSVDGDYKGAVFLADAVKPEAKSFLSRLKSLGVTKTVMLTGDRTAVAESVADRIGITEVRSELLPQEKVSCLEELIASADNRSKVLYVGDGINDAPVIMRADVGVAMGALGSDAALEAADMVLMNDDLNGIADAMRLSKKTHGIVIENITLALAVKFAVLFLSAAGIATNMWYAVFSDVGVLILAVLNAIRNLKG